MMADNAASAPQLAAVLEFSVDARKSAAKRFVSSDIDFFENEDFSINSSKINLADEIARGSYGVVYKGYMEGNTYAIKVEDFIAGEEQTNMLIELSLLQSLSHPRLVQFCGASYVSKSLSAGAKVMILLELCENGALREFLHRPPFMNPNKESWNVLLRMCSDIAEGMDFLHNRHIVHRDIKTTNVLVDENWRAKLCDFSFASHESSTVKRDFVYGTEEFMAPEIAMGMDFNVSADIFSFGMILCEVVSGKEPSADFLVRSPRNMFALDENELRQHVQPDCPEDLQVMALQCCDVDPAYRPSAAQCLEILEMELAAAGGPEGVEAFVESARRNAGTATTASLGFSADALTIDTAVGAMDSLMSAGLISSPNREGTVKYPRTGELDHLRAAMWGQNTDLVAGADNAAGGSVTLEGVVGEFNNRFACMQLEMQQIRAENKKLHTNIHALVALLLEKERLGSNRDRGFGRSEASTGNESELVGTPGNEKYYRERMASIEKRLRDSDVPEEEGDRAQERGQEPTNYVGPDEYNGQPQFEEDRSQDRDDDNDYGDRYQEYGSQPRDDGQYQQQQYDIDPRGSFSQQSQDVEHHYQHQRYEEPPYDEETDSQMPPPPPQQQQPQQQAFSSGQSANTKVALQSFLSSVNKAKAHTSRTLRSVDQNLRSLPVRGQQPPSLQVGPSRGGSQSSQQPRAAIERVEAPPPDNSSVFMSPPPGPSQVDAMRTNELAVSPSPSQSTLFSYSRADSPLSTRRTAGRNMGSPLGNSVRGGTGDAALIMAAAATSVDQRPLQPAPGGPGASGSSRQRIRSSSPSSISGGSLHSTVSMASKGPASVLSTSTHNPVSTKKNVVVHSVPASPRRTTGSQGGLKPAELVQHSTTPGSPARSGREVHTPASAMTTWRENKTPFVRGIAPSSGGREQLRVNTSTNFPDRERNRSVSPTSTIRTNTTSGTVGMGAHNRLPPPPAAGRGRSPTGRDKNMGSNGADSFFHVDPQDVRIEMDYETFQKHSRQRTHSSPLHRASANNGSSNRKEVVPREIEKAVDFQGGLRLRHNLVDRNEGAVAGRKTPVTPIVGLVPSPHASPQTQTKRSSPQSGSSLGIYLKQKS